MSDSYVVTITREFGSLGRPIARELSEILGIEYYDRDIVDEAAKKLNLPVSVVSGEEESARTFFGMKHPLGLGTSEMQDAIFSTQQQIMNTMAGKGPCIIVGRCSDYLFRNKKNTLNIFIYASYDKKLENCITRLNMTPEDAKRSIAEVDRARLRYHLHYTGYAPSDYEYKDLMIDSGVLGVEGTAELLADYVRRRFGIKREGGR